MTRRNGIIAMLSSMAALMSNRAELKADEKKEPHSGTMNTIGNAGPQSVNFDLASFSKFNFRLGTETVSLTPEDIMAALKESRR